MKALIIYDSFFGNTEQIAQAIGNAVGSPIAIDVTRLREVLATQRTSFRPRGITRLSLNEGEME